jgi:hypothetical protein
MVLRCIISSKNYSHLNTYVCNCWTLKLLIKKTQKYVTIRCTLKSLHNSYQFLSGWATTSNLIYHPKIYPSKFSDPGGRRSGHYPVFFSLSYFHQYLLSQYVFSSNELDFNGYTKDPTIQIRMGRIRTFISKGEKNLIFSWRMKFWGSYVRLPFLFT